MDNKRKIDGLCVQENTVLENSGDVEYPNVGKIRQNWNTDPLSRSELKDDLIDSISNFDFTDLSRGSSVAITAGSRGIANIPIIIQIVVNELSDRGYDPFIFPAMGSHGGATANGQRNKLAALGITEQKIGCEIRSSMDVIKIGVTAKHEIPVYADANAAGADAILPINRVKPHTDFDGDIESGLSKMLTIGMGKQQGAKLAHKWALKLSFRNVIPEITKVHLDALPIIGGIAIVEDQYDDTAIIEGIKPSKFLTQEKNLLKKAYTKMPTLPFDKLDVAVFDQIGKDISGPGMDPNVIQRRPYEPEPILEPHNIQRIFARCLTDASQGNANGVGLADVIHSDLAHKIDPKKTLVNTLTASTIRAARIPPTVETDKAGIAACLSTISESDPQKVRFLHAKNTMDLEYLIVSEALLDIARQNEQLDVISEPAPIEFVDGELPVNIWD